MFSSTNSLIHNIYYYYYYYYYHTIIDRINIISIRTYYYYFFFFNQNETECNNIKKCKPTKIKIFSLIVILLIFLLSLLNVLIIWWDPFELYISCKWIMIIGLILYQTTKIILYLLFLERLFTVFVGSSLQFKKSHVIISRIIFLIYLISTLSLILLYGDGKYNYMTESCKSDWPFFLNGIAVTCDFTTCTIVSVLFARRLLSMSIARMKNDKFKKQTSNSAISSVMDDEFLWTVIRKSTLLSWIALFTTSFSLIVMSILGITATWIMLDTMVNCWCIILMFREYKLLYIKICGKLESYISIYCLSCYSCNYCCSIEKDENQTIKIKTRLELHDISNEKSTNTQKSISNNHILPIIKDMHANQEIIKKQISNIQTKRVNTESFSTTATEHCIDINIYNKNNIKNENNKPKMEVVYEHCAQNSNEDNNKNENDKTS